MDTVSRLIILQRRREKITGPPAKVSIVSPADGSVNCQLDTYLSWGKPAMARRYDVYFGETAETLELVSGDQSARVKELSGLELDLTYYFRIDAVNNLGTTTGDVCSFSTWASEDVQLDGNGDPVTDEQGNYIDTRTPS